MINNLGLPAFFETFSYAENYWGDLRQILSNLEPRLKNTNLTSNELHDLMEKTANANVAIVNSFFVEKFEAYLKEFLKKSMNIKAYWLT